MTDPDGNEYHELTPEEVMKLPYEERLDAMEEHLEKAASTYVEAMGIAPKDVLAALEGMKRMIIEDEQRRQAEAQQAQQAKPPNILLIQLPNGKFKGFANPELN